MSNSKKYLLLVIFFAIVLIGSFFLLKNNTISTPAGLTQQTNENPDDSGGLLDDLHPLSIESLRKGEYPGSDIVIEQTLDPGSNYQRYIVSYKSEGLKIYALLTIPNGKKPKNGWSVIIFNHGYIPPTQYRTTERYIAYTDGFSRNGYIVFRPDYRGHGNSEGEPSGAYGSNGYVIDVLNAVSSIKKLKDPTDNRKLITDSNRIGMWGHSLGGFITLRAMVVDKDIKAGVIWAGVVGSYSDLLYNWRRRATSPPPGATSRGWRQTLIDQYGEPDKNPQFWNSISANSYLEDISGPLQLHHGTADTSVPVSFSETLEKQMKEVGKAVELYTYPGDDHNIASYFNSAMQRSIEFFDKYLKQ